MHDPVPAKVFSRPSRKRRKVANMVLARICSKKLPAIDDLAPSQQWLPKSALGCVWILLAAWSFGVTGSLSWSDEPIQTISAAQSIRASSASNEQASAESISAEPLEKDTLVRHAQLSLQLIEHSSAVYLRERECFSCHHQSMSILTLMSARGRGLKVDHDNLERQVKRTIERLELGKEQYKQGQGQGGKVDTAGYALWGLAEAGLPPNSTTDAVIEYLLQTHKDDKHWVCSSNRPPTESSDITTSALALRGLSAFAAEEQASRVSERRQACAQWLAENPPRDTEERVFKMFAAQTLGQESDVVTMRDALWQSQREDGGWAQTTEMTSDAYATGTALYALAKAGVDAEHAAYQRGLRYLLTTQQPDGSWHVTTRSKPIQKYFESGFPHGVDQFISMAATCWATLALLEALPVNSGHLASLPQLSWIPSDALKVAQTDMQSSEDSAKLAEATPEQLEFFERDIRPLLVENCASCHNAEEQSGDLRVDSLAALIGGGESGPALVPYSPQRSLLMKAVRREGELKMPPDDPLATGKVAKLEKWIEMGAPWPKSESSATHAAEKFDKRKLAAHNHWAFQPLAKSLPPEVQRADWATSAVDRFVLAGLENRSLSPAPAANRRDLLRRLSYDLTGMPPTVQELSDFAADTEPDAYERVVDRVLASPRFGEQWGRHWLDIARYSDTKGYVYAREERFFVHAPAYRDWVIDALADDMPYDRFVILQLAADQIVPDDPAAQAAMGFLTIGRRFLGVTHDIIDDRIDVVTRGLLGLTVSCARCHDHKFDPIPTADYYSLYGVFHNSTERRVKLPTRKASTQPATDAELAAKTSFETELAKREQQYRDQLAAQRQTAGERVHAKLTDYLLSQLELEKYPAEGFDVVIAKDDLVPAQVRRFQAYFLEAAERNDNIFSAWRLYQQLPLESFATAAVAVTNQLAALPPERLNRFVAKLFATPPESMQQVAQRYGELFTKLKDVSCENAAEESALAELKQFTEGPNSPCRVPDEDIVSIEQFFDSETCVAMWKLQGEVDRWINQSEQSPGFATQLVDRGHIREPHVFRRGNSLLIGERVDRQFLSILCAPPTSSPVTQNDDSGTVQPSTHQTLLTSRGVSDSDAQITGDHRPTRKPFVHGSGRRELAEAIVDPRNPLTARVWTNRVWQHLFAQGLVSTPSDFGLRATAPSHPELLDWLAIDYLHNGQSTKRLVRQLVLSSTYQQAGTSGEAEQTTFARAAEIDPSNRLLWRASPKRLTFEQRRDTWLMAAEQLDRTRGGRARPLFEGENRRRTIYGLVDRQFLPGVLRVFDFANPDLHTPQRSETTVPQQALFELNHEFTAQMARSIARVIQSKPELSSAQSRIEAMFWQVLGRAPEPAELADAIAFVNQPADLIPQPRVEAAAWQYGFGKLDEATAKVEGFQALPHFTGRAWQGGAAWPDATLGWVQLTATGGHAGNDLQHAAVRRWTAPRVGKVKIQSVAQHDVPVGDGIRAAVVASRGGVLKSEVVHNSKVDFAFEDISVEVRDTLDFVVNFNADLNSDQFAWTPEISLVGESAAVTGELPTHWNAEKDFAGKTPNYLNPWEQLAQVLLVSNEITFVD